jgi:hypothetical protein
MSAGGERRCSVAPRQPAKPTSSIARWRALGVPSGERENGDCGGSRMGQVVEEFGKREGVSDQRSTDAVSNPNRHRRPVVSCGTGSIRLRPLPRQGGAPTNTRPGRPGCLREADPKTAYLDGESCGIGEDGLPSFSQTQAASDGERRAQLVYYAFDLLHLDRGDVCAL